MKLLHVVHTLGLNRTTRQLAWLAPALMRAGWQVEILCLGKANTTAEPLRRAGVVVTPIEWTRPFDLAGWWRLRERLTASAVDLVHVWQRPALRALALARPDWLRRSVVSEVEAVPRPLPRYERWLLQQARDLTLTANLAAVELPKPERLPRAQPSIVCFGELLPEQTFHEAIWALDVLRYLYPAIRLTIIGTGPELARLRKLSKDLRNAGNVFFETNSEAVGEHLRNATACWVPGATSWGRQAALEAMAAGCPVVAADAPVSREVIDDGVNGLLFPLGDVIAMARHTRKLCDDEAMGHRLAAAALKKLSEHHDPAATILSWQKLYRQLAA